jgi:archaellum component FlaG (FlaF/FlaG flagellin family)
VETVREMKAFLVILIVLAAAAGVMAYSHMEVVETILSRTREATTEPATLLVSGSALLLIAIALRRLA